MTSEQIFEIIYPVTSAKYFEVKETSYLYKKAKEVANKLAELIEKEKSKK